MSEREGIKSGQEIPRARLFSPDLTLSLSLSLLSLISTTMPLHLYFHYLSTSICTPHLLSPLSISLSIETPSSQPNLLYPSQQACSSPSLRQTVRQVLVFMRLCNGEDYMKFLLLSFFFQMESRSTNGCQKG